MHHSSENFIIFKIWLFSFVFKICLKSLVFKHTPNTMSAKEKNDKTGQSETSQRNSRIQEMNYS